MKLTFLRRAGAGGGAELRPFLAATLEDLKSLRVALITCSSEVGVLRKDLDTTKEENGKLKYQVLHLKRSLEEEERRNA